MTPVRKVATFRLDDEFWDGLRKVEHRDKIQFSEQIRQAVQMWLELKGVIEPAFFRYPKDRDEAQRWFELKCTMKTTMKTDRKRSATRKRP